MDWKPGDVKRRLGESPLFARVVLMAALGVMVLASAGKANQRTIGERAVSPAGTANQLATENEDCVKKMLEDSAFQSALYEVDKVDPTSDAILYLVIDHKTLEWSVYRSQPGRHKRADEGLSPKVRVVPDNKKAAEILGSDGNPHITRSGKEKVVLVVVNTNPFLYSYTGTVLPPQESPDAAAMRVALGAIGGEIAALLGSRDLSTHKAKLEELNEPHCQSVEEITRHLRDVAKEFEKVRSYVQALETDAESPPVIIRQEIAEAAAQGFKALADLDTLTRDWTERLCYRTWLPLVRLAPLKDIRPEDLAGARAEMIKAQEALWGSESSKCDEITKKAFDIWDSVRSVQEDGERANTLLKKLRESPESSDSFAACGIDQLLSVRDDFLAATAELGAFIQLGESRALLWSESGKTWTWTNMAKTAIIVPPFPEQRSFLDNPGAISIKSETSVSPDCPRLRRTDIEKKFLLISRRQGVLGVGFGTMITNIKDPTYSAVSFPTNDPSQSEYRIVRTLNDSRSGTIMAMLFLRLEPLFNRNAPTHSFEEGVEVGASLDPKRLGFCAGWGFEIQRYIRVGLGVTRQRINKLGEGLKYSTYDNNGLANKDGSVVNGPDSFEVSKDYKWGVYIGLTFAFDALPLFSSSK